MVKNFKKILYLLTTNERKSAALLLVLILIMALIEAIGVASILPFMAVLTNPELIETNIILNNMFQFSKKFGVENNKNFLFVLGILVFLTIVISLTFKLITTYAQLRFAEMRHYSISKRLVEGYLHQPYSWFLNHHSADLGKTILSEVSQVIALGLNPLLELISKSMIAIALIILLIIVDPKLAIIVGLSLGGSYGLIFYFIRSYLDQIGKKLLKNNQLRFMAISEAFGAIKLLKVGGFEKTYIKKYSVSAQSYAESMISSQVTSQIPRFILEAVSFGGVMLIILYLMSQSGSFNNALPIISLYVFAGYRLMPAMQQIYNSLTTLTFVGPSLENLSNNFKDFKLIYPDNNQEILSFNKTITLKNINYRYPDASRITLKDINLNIPAKTKVGIVGTTGSGKTTTVDIILGLLEAQKGTLEVDGQIITKKNLRVWQRSIGYVPQNIYLTDDSVAANIAFGLETKDINQKIVEKVSKIANLHEFVMSELPNQYQTKIGENGIRLSGGQRQRIGIARALYHNPKVLILDEASSALDDLTEKIVMDAINNISKDVTIILIAHRLNTLKNCDSIFKFDQGRIINQERIS